MTLDEKNGWKEVPCPSCGKTVVWADITKADGKRGRVPLDPKPPVYLVTKDDQAVRADQKREHEARYMVSHFATCKNPPERERR